MRNCSHINVSIRFIEKWTDLQAHYISTLKFIVVYTIYLGAWSVPLDLVMQIPAGFEWILIIVVIVVLFFGVKKIPQLARSFGKATSEYEKARIEAKRELQQIKNQEPTNVDREKLEAIAETLGIDYTNKNDEDLRVAIESEINKGKNKV